MKKYQSTAEPVWPYVGVVACLFVLSVFAARSWHVRPSQPAHQPQTVPPFEPTAADFGVDSWVPPNAGFASHAITAPVLRARDLEPPIKHQVELPPRKVATAAPMETSEITLVPANSSKPNPSRAIELEDPELAGSQMGTPEPRAPELRDSLSRGPELRGPELRSPELGGPELETVELAPVAVQPAPLALTPPQPARLAPPVAGPITGISPAMESQVETASPETASSSRRSTRLNRQADMAALSPAETEPTGESDPEPPLESDWPTPSAMTDDLAALRSHPSSRPWAQEVEAAFESIRRLGDLASPAVDDILLQLQHLARRGRTIAESADDPSLRTQLLRMAYSVERRRVVWDRIHHIAANANHGMVSVGFHDLEPILEKVDRHLGPSQTADDWRQYLRLDELRLANDVGDAASQRKLARRMLERIEISDSLSDEQRSYLANPPFTELAKGLGRWAREPIDYTQLLRALEEYEESRRSAAAGKLARTWQVARWSDQSAVHDLGETLDQHYRNANLRVAVNVDLVNRLLPKPATVREEVSEHILGAYVSGTSETSSDLKVVLEPDQELWRMRLQAEGSVKSRTAATKGPATFYNDGISDFAASKTLLVDRRGVKVNLAEAEADSQSELTGFETQFDPLPLFGRLARAIARQQHDGRYGEARAATEARLEQRAKETLDEEVHHRLEEIEGDFQDRILVPFTSLDLRPRAIDMHTTTDRLVIRYRLAGIDQLGAHTARPQAPSDSLLSVQMHETVLNNIVDQLELEGTRDTLPAIYEKIGRRFNRSIDLPEDLPSDVFLKFAKRDPLRIRFLDGRVTLTARIAELSNPRHSWRGFAVRVHYVPDPLQVEANLVRDGVVELAGSRLRLGDQIALRGIFSKVFSRSRPLNLINKRIENHPRMNDLHVTQCTITDGWMGIALGPERSPDLANRPSPARF